jgi:adenosylcobinamide-GDP ribazoletransferase
MSKQYIVKFISQFISKLLGAITFYTVLPIPQHWQLNFHGIAKMAPLVGLLIGAILGLIDFCLLNLGMPTFTRSTLVIVSGIALTGGLHLDGVMDTADGLAVTDPQRRLKVMSDSVTGAFGVMTAIALISIKIAALTDLTNYRWLTLMAIASWGRWGQLLAIARYPYLKAEGKGAFHQLVIYRKRDLLLTALFPLTISLLIIGLDFFLKQQFTWQFPLTLSLAGIAIAYLTGAWFHRQLGGHTGDTYGAVVEWTESLLLAFILIV